MRLLFFLIMFCFILLYPNFVYAVCLNTTDDFAVEVILNKLNITYNLDSLKQARNVNFYRGEYIFRSQYSPYLGTIISETQNGFSDLSVRLQKPVKTIVREIPFFRLTSRIRVVDLVVSRSKIKTWNINCSRDSPISNCIFKKNNLVLEFDSSSKNVYLVKLNINNEKIASCSDSCDGRCIFSFGDELCIPEDIVSDVEEVILNTNLFEDFEDLAKSARIENNIKNIQDLDPVYDLEIEWGEALFKELLWLGDKELISISWRDIDDISSLARQGSAGDKRIIYYKQEDQGGKWIHYNNTGLGLSEDFVCEEFDEALLFQETPLFKTEYVSSFYKIPLLIVVFLLILFLIFIIIGRALNKK